MFESAANAENHTIKERNEELGLDNEIKGINIIFTEDNLITGQW